MRQSFIYQKKLGRLQGIERTLLQASPLINLIDVLLLMLVFFILTSSIRPSKILDIVLPKASLLQESQRNDKQIEISIDAEGKILVNSQYLADSSESVLRDAITTYNGQGKFADLQVVVQTDSQAPAQSLVTVFAVVSALGVGSLELKAEELAAKNK